MRKNWTPQKLSPRMELALTLWVGGKSRSEVHDELNVHPDTLGAYINSDVGRAFIQRLKERRFVSVTPELTMVSFSGVTLEPSEV